MLLTRRGKQRTSSTTTAINPAICILLLLTACGLVTCDAYNKPQADAQGSLALVGHNIDAVNWAASASYHQQDSDSAVQLDTPGSESSTSPPLQETVRRDSFPDIELDNTPSLSPFANQEQLALTQHTLPSALKVTASGLAGVAEAGKSLFDGIAQVLQQSQFAWANLENAANLTRLVQESLSNRFGDQIFSSPFSLSINGSMQTEPPTNASQASASRANETFWFQLIEHNGNATYNPNPSTYQVYRNVKDFGAKGE